MSNLLIKSAKIVDTNSSFNGKTVDILIEGGRIASIGKPVKSKNVPLFTAPGLHVSQGWFDLRANFRDPGYEYKEDIASGIKAAASGGFTGIAVMPSTHPPLHSKAGIEYIKSRSAGAVADVFPIGAVTQKLEGKELTEMYDMHRSGAVAFSDDKNPIADAGVFCRALQYLKSFNALLIAHCEDRSLTLTGNMNEGTMNVTLGLKGMPALAEEIILSRNIHLAEYTGGRLHIASVSCANSVDLIRNAKKKGIAVSADIAAHQIAFDDSALSQFDTNLKVNPPFRTRHDIQALQKALAENVIEVICSDHSPEDEENKKREFDTASFGITGLETAFAVANTHLRKILPLEELIQKISSNPRKILNLNIPVIEAGNVANLTLFDPKMNWTFKDEHIRSKSKNTPFLNHKFVGKALAVFNNGKFVQVL